MITKSLKNLFRVFKHNGNAIRDYEKAWIRENGKDYRLNVYERQKKGGMLPLVDNPTIDEMRAQIDVYRPKSILELGCGWGRLLEPLREFYPNIQGCDISKDMMARANPLLKIFYWDIVKAPCPIKASYDVVFCRGVFIYFSPGQIAAALKHILPATNKALIIWEWPEIIDKICCASCDPRIVFCPIAHKKE